MAVQDLLAAEAPPLELSDGGTLRVRGTRVSLETLIGAFQDGAEPEQIVLRYPSVSLKDAYAVIGHYLRHQEEVDAYVAQRRQQAESTRQKMEARFPSQGIRERLLARKLTTP